MRQRAITIATLLGILGLPNPNAQAQFGVDDLRRLSIEELGNIEVTTVSRIPAPSSTVPAAIYVITQEEIRRSGATTLAELLRSSPGVHVARIDASKWAVGIRGFTDRLSRSMLVAIDGRPVYSPLFAGTYWEVQELLLQDIERIEVVRGPGGTLWGPNAVNGIVNVVTKPSDETSGWLFQAGGGTEQHGLAAFRYGGAAGQNLDYRVYGKFRNRDAAFRPAGDWGDWRIGQAGFRADWSRSATRTLTFQGDIYTATDEKLGQIQTFEPPHVQPLRKDADLSGANILGRWEEQLASDSSFSLQLYYDRTRREDLAVEELRDTFSVDFQYSFRPLAAHQIVGGIGYRVTSDDTHAVPTERFIPASRTDNLYTAFVHDEITLVPERLRLTVGSKFERNAYSGVEVQPSARLSWLPANSHTLFASVAHAVRTPTRVEHDYEVHQILDPGLPAFLRKIPNEDFQPEKIVAYEAGYRVRPVDSLLVTVTGFFNHHRDLLSTEVGTPFFEVDSGSLRVFLPLIWANNLDGNSHGVELSMDYRPTAWWRWAGSYSGLRIQLTPDPDSAGDLSQEAAAEGNSPRHQAQFRSSVDLGERTDLDWTFRYVSRLPNQRISGYATSDLRLAWRPNPSLELALVGQDLHEARHSEFGGGAAIERSVYGQILWEWP